MIQRKQIPLFVRTKRNFLSLSVAVALVIGSLIVLDSAPGTPFSVLLLAVLGLVGISVLAGLYIWALIGPAISTGTPIIGTGPTPPPEEDSDRAS